MSDSSKKSSKKDSPLEQELAELTTDLQRVQADFVNYRQRVEDERQQLAKNAKAATVIKLLPIVDNIERALSHLPTDLADNKWAQGVTSLAKSLDKSLADLGVARISALGKPFDPNLHEAISSEGGEGEHEVVVEELRAGYTLDNQVIQPSMVKVAHRPFAQSDDPSRDDR